MIRTRAPLRAILVSLCVLSSSGSAIAQSADAFDAVCEIRNAYSNSDLDESDPDRRGVETLSLRFRIDLSSRTFCVDNCLAGIFEIGPSENLSELNLTYTGVVRFQGELRRIQVPNTVFLNRQSGAVSFAHVSGSFPTSGAGSCRREAFSGFPEAVF